MSDASRFAAIRELELRLLDPRVRRSPEELDRLLADDFIEFGSSGRILDKTQTLEMLPGQPTFEYAIRDFQIRPLGAELALATYHISIRDDTGSSARGSLRSSLWRTVHDRWQLVFHQGTVANQHRNE